MLISCTSHLQPSCHANTALISCNWVGVGGCWCFAQFVDAPSKVYNTVLAMNWYGKDQLKKTPLTDITLHGTSIASVANVDNFHFA